MAATWRMSSRGTILIETGVRQLFEDEGAREDPAAGIEASFSIEGAGRAEERIL